MVNFNVRQLTIMKQKIDAFVKGDIYLFHLIEDLEALLDFLEESDIEWKKKIRRSWANLETIMALNLDKNDGYLILTDEEIKEINVDVEKLKKLVEFKLNEQTKHCED